MRNQPPGTVFCLAAGTYRMTEKVTPKDNDQFIGAGSGITILSGAKIITDWVSSGGLWRHAGDVVQLPRGGQCHPGSECQYPDWLLRDGSFLTRVVSPCTTSNVTAGTFCVDYATATIYVLDPSGTFEYSYVPKALDGGVGVVLRELTITKYANTAGSGAVVRAGTNWLVEGIEMSWNHACPIAIVGSSGTRVAGSHLHHNGQEGACGKSTGATFTGNEVDHNNLLGFEGLWEGGGVKFVRTVNLTVTGNSIHHNNGAGLWFDIDSTGAVISGNTVNENSDVYGNGHGIMYEISCFARITTNKTSGNARSGVLVANSHDVTVLDNIVANNERYGVRVMADSRSVTQPNCGESIHVFNVTVATNEITMPAGKSISGLQRVAPAIADHVSFVGNHYYLTGGSCSDRRWKWWNGNAMDTVKFSGSGTTWQGSYRQDEGPKGSCSSA